MPEIPESFDGAADSGLSSHDLLCKIAGEAALNGADQSSATIRMARCLRYLLTQIGIAANGAKSDGAKDVETYLREVKESAEKILHNDRTLATQPAKIDSDC